MLSNTTSEYRLLQWNTLGKMFCDQKSFPKVDEKYLSWDYRKGLLKSIIEKIGADIMTFQEIDSYDEYKTDIVSDNYDSTYFAKDDGGQGIAVFFKKEIFELIKSEKISLPKDDNGNISNQFFSYNIFRDIKTGKYFCIVTTHLKSKAEFEAVRLCQVKFMLNYLDKFYESLQDEYGKCSLILSGDFNAEPSYSSIKEVENFVLRNGEKFTSVFDCQNGEIEMTTFKIRDKAYYRIIDYIYYIGDIIITSKLYPPKIEDFKDISDKGLPSADFPSDHYYLCFNFQ
jgi:mRNA deadenylase 3'-5' endonuclease subunit Ccr4